MNEIKFIDKKMASLHEVFHNYYAVNGGGHVSAHYIMHSSIIFGGWFLHSDTESDVSSYITHFDGPP
ncbi:MAG: hypothetical protein ACXACR_17420 [Candidatus Hodarchaeales archaeon]|jgi:hypothetical protein